MALGIMVMRWLMPLVVMVSFLRLQRVQSVNTNFPNTVCEVYQKDGDYILGGIFRPYDSASCDGEVSGRMSFIEAMTYTIETFNNRTDVLPGVQLGYEIRNACDDDEDITAWTMITMTTSFKQTEFTDTCPEQNRTNSGQVIGVIGPSRSSASIIASKIGRISTVPIVSFFSTSDELRDSGRFPFFFRTVPADKFQVEVMVDILRYFNWKYIALFYILDSYGIHGARQIIRKSEIYDICIAINMPIALPVSESDIDDIAIKLSSEDKVSVIIAFSTNIVGEAILKAVTRMDNPRNFTFIGSDGWDPNEVNLRDYVDVIRGGIFVHFLSEMPVTFQEYFRQLPYNQDQTSPWYQKKLNQISTAENCTNWTSCPVPNVHWNTQQVIRAVELIAYSLDATLRQEAGQNISTYQPVDGWILRENLLGVSIPLGPDNTFRFDENGEVPGRYMIRNWQFKNGQYDLVEIGNWDSLNEPQLFLSDNKIQWNTPNEQVPTSICVDDCPPGYIEVPLEKKCCFGCQKCNDYAIVVKQNATATCQDCLTTHWPDSFRTTCMPIKESFLEYRDPIVVVLVTAAFIGLILIIVAAMGYWHYSEHILIKASGRELSPINLFGLGLSCITILLLNFLKPSDAACVICEIGISTSFCSSFAPVLLKVNRIWRIFYLRPRRGVRPMFTSPKSQLLMVALIIIVQVVLSLISIPFGRSKPDLLFPPQRKPYLGIYCKFSSGFIISCIYNAGILAASSYFAFRARRVPDNFNESKFIAVSVYSTILVCLAAVPVYATADEVSQRVAALSVPLLLNAYLSMVCLYVPKMYAIRYDKEINATRTWKTSTAVASDADHTWKSSAMPSEHMDTIPPKSEVMSEVSSTQEKEISTQEQDLPKSEVSSKVSSSQEKEISTQDQEIPKSSEVVSTQEQVIPPKYEPN